MNSNEWPSNVFIIMIVNAYFQNSRSVWSAECKLWSFLLHSSTVILQFQFVNHCCYHFGGSDGWRILLFFHTLLSFHFLPFYSSVFAFIFMVLTVVVVNFFFLPTSNRFSNQQIFIKWCFIYDWRERWCVPKCCAHAHRTMIKSNFLLYYNKVMQ